MKKSILEPFLKKYHLAGINDVAKLKFIAADKKLIAEASTPNNVLTANIQLLNCSDLPELEFGINNTTKLLKMLNALSDDITLSAINEEGRVTGIIINDINVELQYVTADLKTLSIRGFKKTDIAYDAELIIDKDFIETFICAKAALPDAEHVAFQTNKLGTIEMVFGQVNGNNNKLLNTSTIKYKPKVVDGKDKLPLPLLFNAVYIKEVLLANKEASETTLKLNPYPLANMSFTTNDIVSSYHMVGIIGK
jgi:hypothetical protein